MWHFGCCIGEHTLPAAVPQWRDGGLFGELGHSSALHARGTQLSDQGNLTVAPTQCSFFICISMWWQTIITKWFIIIYNKHHLLIYEKSLPLFRMGYWRTRNYSLRECTQLEKEKKEVFKKVFSIQFISTCLLDLKKPNMSFSFVKSAAFSLCHISESFSNTAAKYFTMDV